MSESSGELAQDRTDLAEDRTLLAHERSFASWLRTGMASIGIALGFHALFRSMEPTWAAKTIASVFLVIAIVVFISAERRACGVISKLDAHKVGSLRRVRVRILAYALSAATFGLMAAMWLLVEA